MLAHLSNRRHLRCLTQLLFRSGLWQRATMLCSLVLLHLTCSCICVQREARTGTSLHWVSQRALHHCQWAPGALWMLAGWWMSLPWAALLKHLSIRLQLHGPPRVWLDPGGSRFRLVITHTATAGDATEAAIGAQRVDSLRKSFWHEERISCKMWSRMVSVARGRRRGWRRDIRTGWLCYFSHLLFHTESLVQDSVH